MASQAFPPTPAPPAGAHAPGAAAPPSPVGTAVGQAPGNLQAVVTRVKSAIQDLMMFTQQIQQVKPDAAAKMVQGIQQFMQGIGELGGGQAPPTAPQGSVPPPPQMTPSPAQTPEAT